MHIESDDVRLSKAAIIERSIGRPLEEFALDPRSGSHAHIDAMTLNIERACQGAIDFALHVIAADRLGMPQTSADAFHLLLNSGRIGQDPARDTVAMTGFRNIAIHEYQAIDMTILRVIGEEQWRSLVAYCKELGIKKSIRRLIERKRK
jgi:uncharacterized protein YutE (UPF0331/DUF86 family)